MQKRSNFQISDFAESFKSFCKFVEKSFLSKSDKFLNLYFCKAKFILSISCLSSSVIGDCNKLSIHFSIKEGFTLKSLQLLKRAFSVFKYSTLLNGFWLNVSSQIILLFGSSSVKRRSISRFSVFESVSAEGFNANTIIANTQETNISISENGKRVRRKVFPHERSQNVLSKIKIKDGNKQKQSAILSCRLAFFIDSERVKNPIETTAKEAE